MNRLKSGRGELRRLEKRYELARKGSNGFEEAAAAFIFELRMQADLARTRAITDSFRTGGLLMKAARHELRALSLSLEITDVRPDDLFDRVNEVLLALEDSVDHAMKDQIGSRSWAKVRDIVDEVRQDVADLRLQAGRS